MLSFSLLVHHPLPKAPPDSLASRVGWRTEVCPPSLRTAPRSTWHRLWFWLMAPGPLQASPGPDRLPPVRSDFIDSLRDLDVPEAKGLSYRIDQARSLRDLWHLRTELYSLVARSHSQHEADRRVAQLNRHFPTRAPRSGFAPLLP